MKKNQPAAHDYSHGHSHDGREHSHSHNHDNHEHGHEGYSHCGHGHRHVHPEAEQKAIINRLSRAIGHLESIRRMVSDDRECSEVLIQLSAVKAAINNTGKIILKNHIEHCIVDAVKHDDYKQIEELKTAIDRFMK